MVGRLVFSLLLQSYRGKVFIVCFEGVDDGVYVWLLGYCLWLCWIILLLVGLVIVFLFFVIKYLLIVVIFGLIYVLFGLGLNIVVGFVGLFDLGYVVFYVIGVYGLVLGYQYLGFGFWVMLLLGVVMVVFVGVLLGFLVLCMYGDYLVIVIFGFGEIICLVFNNWVSFIGGFNGVLVLFFMLFGFEFICRVKDGGIFIYEFFYVSYNFNLKFIFFYVVLCLLVLLVKYCLMWMFIGCVWEVLCEDEIVCWVMGFNYVLVKFLVFMFGVLMVGIVGVFFVSYQGFVNLMLFIFFELVLILVIVVFGGMGFILGVVLVVFVLMVILELLCGFDEYWVLLFGVLMVMMMIWWLCGLVCISCSGVVL